MPWVQDHYAYPMNPRLSQKTPINFTSNTTSIYKGERKKKVMTIIRIMQVRDYAGKNH